MSTPEPMRVARALSVVAEIAAAWGENEEESLMSHGLDRRIDAADTDEVLAELAQQADDFVQAEDLETLRDLWQAMDLLKHISAQRGCETWDPAITDGKLTTLMDIVIFG